MNVTTRKVDPVQRSRKVLHGFTSQCIDCETSNGMYEGPGMETFQAPYQEYSLSCFWKEGKKNGKGSLYKSTDLSNVLIMQGVFENDELTGYVKWFDESNGDLKLEGNVKDGMWSGMIREHDVLTGKTHEIEYINGISVLDRIVEVDMKHLESIWNGIGEMKCFAITQEIQIFLMYLSMFVLRNHDIRFLVALVFTTEVLTFLKWFSFCTTFIDLTYSLMNVIVFPMSVYLSASLCESCFSLHTEYLWTPLEVVALVVVALANIYSIIICLFMTVISIKLLYHNAKLGSQNSKLVVTHPKSKEMMRIRWILVPSFKC